MERTRFIAAAPVRSASEAWRVLCELIADTLERSSSVMTGSVSRELLCLKGIGPALIAGGHFEDEGLVLVDKELYATVRVLTADAAVELNENLNPIPGGASTTIGWTLYLPSLGPLKDAVDVAIKNSPHLFIGKPQASARTIKIENEVDPIVDLDSIRRLGRAR